MTIYLTNAATVAAVARATSTGKPAKPETAACVGPGPVLSIMRHPRAEMGDAGTGRVLALTPPSGLAWSAIAAKLAGDRASEAFDLAAWREYEEALRARWLAPEHVRRCAPGALAYGREVYPERSGGAARPWDGAWWVEVDDVPDGATLICACSREAAGSGRCHRVIAADVLRVAGWDVVLDGREVR